MKKKSDVLICLLCGGLTGASLLLPSIGFAVFMTAAPAFAILAKKSRFKSFFAFALGLCMVGYSPVFSVNPGFDTATNLLLDLMVYVVICLVHGSILALSLFLAFKLPCPRGFRPFYAAVLWTSAEWLFGYGALAWPTLRLSLALWQYPFFLQSASFGGQLLVTAVIIFVNMLLASAKNAETTKKSALCGGFALLVFISNLLFGAFSPKLPEKDTSVALIQPGYNLISGYSQWEISQKAHELALEAAEKKPRLMVLPESALPPIFSEDELSGIYPWGSLTLISGGDMIACGNRMNRSFAYHFGSDGKLRNMRKKLLEVPFFENGVAAPFRWVAEKEEPPVETDSGKLGILICYESMFSSFARAHAENGAELFCVVTNDSWFDTHLARNLHLAHGVYRAVETGRYLVQSALNGTTAVIDPYGNVVSSIEAKEPGVLYEDVSLTPADTTYLEYGDLWLLICFILVALMSVITNFKRGCSKVFLP